MSRKPDRPRGTTPATPAAPPAAAWTFFTNHTHVLVCLLQDPKARLREVAARIGITERAVQKIVLELETAGVLTRHRDGRRNRYHIDLDRPLRHPVESHVALRQVLAPILGRSPGRATPKKRLEARSPGPPAEAEGGGFEPPRQLPAYAISNRVPSATRTPLRG